MTSGRRLWAALDLLDRQLVDRGGRLVGCVDDVELVRGDSGTWYVSALLSGPGVLAERIGIRRYGQWRQRVHQLLHDDQSGREGQSLRPPARIGLHRVRELGSRISLAADAEDLGNATTEHWAREHVIRFILGSGHAPQ
jgi:hypothetical protein